jgi:hypothetical protein
VVVIRLLAAAGACLVAVSACTDVETEVVAVPASVELIARAVRCTQCAWIESKRQVDVLSYEYTVRMGDGSARVFQEPLPASWRVGERLILID